MLPGEGTRDLGCMAGKQKWMSILRPDKEFETYVKILYFMVQNSNQGFFSKGAKASKVYTGKKTGSSDSSRVTKSEVRETRQGKCQRQNRRWENPNQDTGNGDERQGCVGDTLPLPKRSPVSASLL